MKKLLCITLALLMTVSLLACQGNPESTEETTESISLSVGFGKADITPDRSMLLGGFGGAGKLPRMSEGVLNRLYITCVAMTDPAGATLLLMSCDTQAIGTTEAYQLRKSISQATGVDQKNIALSATHSHSTPVVSNSYPEFFNGAVQAAKEAMADRCDATMEYTAVNLEKMTFVRHYNTDTGVVVGDNFVPDGAGKRISHTTEADKELRVVRFVRAGKKTVVMANWLGHATKASTGTTRYGQENHNYISSDYVGFCRDYIEENSDYHFVMYMGASGNVNTASRITSEHLTTSAEEYGYELGKQVLAAVENMTQGEIGYIKVKMGQFEKTDDTMEIDAYGMGSLGVVIAPFEMFDTTGMKIRENSPFDTTFVLTQANGSHIYMPTEICYDYIDCYEVRVSTFQKGDAEKIVWQYVDMLKSLKD